MKPVCDITLQEVSARAEGPSHSTDQPGGKVQGQVKPAINSTKSDLKNSDTSKAEQLILSKTYPSPDIP